MLKVKDQDGVEPTIAHPNGYLETREPAIANTIPGVASYKVSSR